ncbi:MAG: SulP family inorganic anion transporter [Usitatibacter sp.]
MESHLARAGAWVPIPDWARGYGRGLLHDDAVAGITAAAVIVPIAMAHATIAGLAVQAGLCTVIVPMIVYAFVGSSRVLSVSTTSTIAVLVAAATAQVVPGASPEQAAGVASTLAVVAGAMLMAASIVRFGFVANFISQPVLTGFKAGIGLVIIVDQVPKLLGIHIVKKGFFRDVLAILEGLPVASVATLGVGIAVMAIVFGGRRWAPRAPAPLIGIAAAILASAAFGLKAAGVETVGEIQGGLPGFVMPRLDLVGELWPAAIGVALMSFTESIAAGRAFTLAGERRPMANRELLATGAASLAGGFFGAMPCGGGTTQTAVNRNAGARTQVAALVTAAFAAAALAFLGPVIELMPRAALAAVVRAYSVGLIKIGEFRAIRSVRTTEFRWALIAFGGVLVLGTLRGIVVAIVASLLALLHQANNPPVYAVGRKHGTDVFRPRSEAHPTDETWPGLLILRPQGRIYFANAECVGDKMWAMFDEAKPNVVLLDLGAVSDIEYTALNMLSEGEAKLREKGAVLWLAALNPHVLDIVRDTALGRRLGRERMFFNVQTAVDAYERAGAER